MKVIPIRPEVGVMAKHEKPKYLFSPIPPRAFKDKRLSASHWRVLTAVSYYDRFDANKTGCYANQSTLAQQTDMTRSMVNRNLRDLEAWGYLTTRYAATGKNRIQIAVIHEPVGVRNSAQQYGKGCAEFGTEGCAESRISKNAKTAENPKSFKGFGDEDLIGIYSTKQKTNISGETPEGYTPEGAHHRGDEAVPMEESEQDEADVTTRVCQIENQFKRHRNNPLWLQSDTPKLLCNELFQIADGYDELEIRGHAERVLTDIELELDEVA